MTKQYPTFAEILRTIAGEVTHQDKQRQADRLTLDDCHRLTGIYRKTIRQARAATRMHVRCLRSARTMGRADLEPTLAGHIAGWRDTCNSAALVLRVLRERIAALSE